jgi:Domain of unknown function (DUF4129)
VVITLLAHAGAPGPAGPWHGIGRQAAQRLARAELSKRIYHRHPSLLRQILDAVTRWLDRLFREASAAPGGWWGLVALLIVLVVVIAVILHRIGPVARTRRRAPEPVRGTHARTARELRDSATALAASGDYSGAICETVRAIAAELDERMVLPPRAGRTADEFAAEAGQALPRHAADLRAATRPFNEIRYGHRSGNRQGYERVRELDSAIKVSAARPAAPQAVPQLTGSAAR